MSSVVSTNTDRWSMIAPKLTSAAERAGKTMVKAMERAAEAEACAEACADDESIPGDVLSGIIIEEVRFTAKALEADRRRVALLGRIERGPGGSIPRAPWKREELLRVHARARDGKLTPKTLRAEVARICAAADPGALEALRVAAAEARKIVAK